MNMKLSFNKKRISIIFLLLLLAAAAAAAGLRGCGSFSAAPTVTLETPQRKSAEDHEPFSLALGLNCLEENVLYPAASFSIRFDPSKLEFLGVEEGNVPITDSASSSGYQLPQWSVNVERSNELGQINLMYLDTTGGTRAFVQQGLAESGNVLLRLRFRLRGSAAAGDIYELGFDDAIFAAPEESRSLALSANSLRAVNGRIVVGGKV